MNANHRKAIRDFVGYLRELRSGCVTAERRRELHREAVTCGDLMNYSPLHIDFSVLDPLVGAVMIETARDCDCGFSPTPSGIKTEAVK